MSICPARIAAYKGVHFVVLCALHFAPALIRQSTCSMYPFWQALKCININNFNLQSMDREAREQIPLQTHRKSKEFCSVGAKFTASSFSMFKSLMIRSVILTLFSKTALRKISYSVTK